MVSPAEMIGSTEAPGASGTRYAGFAVLEPGTFFDDAPPATASAMTATIAAKAVSRFINSPLFSAVTRTLGGGTLKRRARGCATREPEGLEPAPGASSSPSSESAQ